VLGAPFLYGTTQDFLEYLGLNSLKDLPSMEDLEALLAKEASAEIAMDGDGPAETLGGDALVERIVAETGIEEGPSERDEERMEEAAPVASAARLGPHIQEPMNRPVTGGIQAADEADDEDASDAAAEDENDDTHP
jgi:hypothetical protein